MEKLRQYGLTIATIAIALGIGFVVQMDATPRSLGYGPSIQASAAATMRTDAEPSLALQGIALTSAQDQPDMVEPVLAAATAQDTVQPVKPVQSPAEPVCDVAATAETRPGAMIALSVSAPCLPNEQITVHHNGMMFTASTDDTGSMGVSVPALAAQAVIIVEFPTGQGAVAVADVPSLSFYDRVALQWSGKSGFQLHALEYGAGYGEDGHVWAGSPRSPDAAAMGNQGFVTQLGLPDGVVPRIAEVYTFPRATASRDGQIVLSIEAEVTAENCGRRIDAQSLQMREDGVLRTSDVTLTVPACDAVGSFLVLNNLLDDLKIAAK